MEVQSPQSNFPRDHRDPTDIASRGSLVRLSPEEPFHAWIFCAAASIRNGDDQLQPWLEMIVAIPLEFRLLEEKKDIFWAQVAEREALGHKFGAMFRTPSGRILEILHFAGAEGARLRLALSLVACYALHHFSSLFASFQVSCHPKLYVRKTFVPDFLIGWFENLVVKEWI